MDTMESQLQDLRGRLGGDQEVFEWLGRALSYENLAIKELKRVGLDRLAELGLSCIKEKFPCPNSQRRNH